MVRVDEPAHRDEHDERDRDARSSRGGTGGRRRPDRGSSRPPSPAAAPSQTTPTHCASARTISATPTPASRKRPRYQNGRKRRFHACSSGHSRNTSAKTPGEGDEREHRAVAADQPDDHPDRREREDPPELGREEVVEVPGELLVPHVRRVRERREQRDAPERGEQRADDPDRARDAERSAPGGGRARRPARAMTTKIPTTMWLSTAPRAAPPAARAGVASAASTPSAPRNPSANASANENEYSPASALTIGPPMIRWLNWIVASWVPGAAVDALEEEEERGEHREELRAPGAGRSGPDRARRRSTGIRTRPSAVTSLNATLYGMTRSSEDRQQCRDREVELAGREPREPVRRPPGDPPVRQEVVLQVGREPDVRPHVAAVGGRVPQQQRRVELPEHDHAARDDDHDAEPAPGQAEVTIGRRERRRRRPPGTSGGGPGSGASASGGSSLTVMPSAWQPQAAVPLQPGPLGPELRRGPSRALVAHDGS